MQGIWEWLHLEKCFFSKSARRQRTCMYVRIVRDISLIFNEFKDAPLWFLCNYYTARIRVIGVNLDQGKRNLVRFSKKFELSKGESEPRSDGKIQGKWFQLAVSSSYPSSSYTGGLGRFSSIFLSLFAIDQLRKIKSNRMETIIHKMRRDQERPNQSVFSVHSAFRFNHWRQDVLSPVPSPYPSIDNEIKTTSGYWTCTSREATCFSEWY